MLKLVKILTLTLLTTAVSIAAAAPVGYSINSDSGSGNADSLYRIDLATGAETRVGPVGSFGEARIDVEGLAFSPDGILYGVDDESSTLFPINPDNGQVQKSSEVPIRDLPVGGNDFGMTFACDGNLYLTSLGTGTLYSLDLEGNTTPIGNEGDLGVNISALAAYGENPVQLYGLGNGLDGNLDPDAKALFSIDINSGVATQIGTGLGGAAGDYTEGGLAFDDDGQLWAITDRRQLDAPSQVMKIDTGTGVASDVSTTSEAGFESLAITVPRGCAGGSEENAYFKVQKQFMDGNASLPSTVNITCNAGLELEQSYTMEPGGPNEVTFTVTDFQDGELDCVIEEETSDDYYASYDCFSTGNCAATATRCQFTETASGQDNLCVIRNYPQAVDVTVAAEWVYGTAELATPAEVAVDLYCRNVIGGDGEWDGGSMRWSWLFSNAGPGDPDPVVIPGPLFETAAIQPMADGSAECRVDVEPVISRVESFSDCGEWQPALTGSGTLVCTVTTTDFYEGIPTLSRGGLLLASLLMLLTGLVFIRRF